MAETRNCVCMWVGGGAGDLGRSSCLVIMHLSRLTFYCGGAATRWEYASMRT